MSRVRGRDRDRSSLRWATRVRSQPLVAQLTLVGPPLFNGGLSLEAAVTDGRTGARLAALSWADEGRLNPVGSYTKYGHPKTLTQTFSRAMAELLAVHAP